MEEGAANMTANPNWIPAGITGYSFNQTRQTFLASELKIAASHISRLLGLMFTSPDSFGFGSGLWIVPSHGVHTLFMRFSIDVVYLDNEDVVVHVEENVKPWRMAPLVMEAATVLELPAHTIWNTGTAIGDQIENAFDKKHGAVA
jgi:uncharacterized membrane protein (UPF0127 family)